MPKSVSALHTSSFLMNEQVAMKKAVSKLLVLTMVKALPGEKRLEI